MYMTEQEAATANWHARRKALDDLFSLLDDDRKRKALLDCDDGVLSFAAALESIVRQNGENIDMLMRCPPLGFDDYDTKETRALHQLIEIKGA